MTRAARKVSIFVVGVPRSGTTLLAAMLAAHSQLSCGPETHLFRYLHEDDYHRLCDPAAWPEPAIDFLFSMRHAGSSVPENYQVSRSELRQRLSADLPSVRAVLSGLVEAHMERTGKMRWVEKTPNHIAHVFEIRKHFPESLVIKIVRDPRDVALSLLKVPWGPKTFDEGVEIWHMLETAAQPFFREDLLSCSVRYEDLVLNPRRELDLICRFIGEPFEARMLDTSRSALEVNMAGEPWKRNAASPPDSRRVFAWKDGLPFRHRVHAYVIAKSLIQIYKYDKFF
jgi:hypothetical protein